MPRPGFSRLTVWTGAAFALAVAVRWFVVLRYYRHLPLGFTDNFFYHSTANLLADGRGFQNPFALAAAAEAAGGSGSSAVAVASTPSAAHPPLFSLYLAGWSLLGADTPLWHRLASGLVSAAAVIPAALLADRLAGRRAAASAAIGVAVYPPLWMNDGLILSESLYIPLAAVSLLAAYRVAEQPSLTAVAVLSAVLAAGALTRSEALLLFPLMLVPIVLTRRGVPLSVRLRWIAAAAAATAAVLAPWAVRNLAVFDEPTILSAGAGYVLEVGNCDLTYSGPFLGYWHIGCDQSAWAEGDESVIGARKLAIAEDYILAHLGQTPKVAAARVGRLFGVFRPFQTADFDVLFERRVRSHVRAGLWAHWAASALAAAGAVILHRRGRTLLPPLAMVAGAAVTAAASFGITRYRVGADTAVVVLAAVAAIALADGLRSPASSRTPLFGRSPASRPQSARRRVSPTRPESARRRVSPTRPHPSRRRHPEEAA